MDTGPQAQGWRTHPPPGPEAAASWLMLTMKGVNRPHRPADAHSPGICAWVCPGGLWSLPFICSVLSSGRAECHACGRRARRACSTFLFLPCDQDVCAAWETTSFWDSGLRQGGAHAQPGVAWLWVSCFSSRASRC